MKYLTASLAAVSLYETFASAQQCENTISPSEYPAPVLADGWGAHIIANGFVKPRSMKLDSAGHLLVVDQDAETGSGGIWRLTFGGEAPCLTETDRVHLINNASVS
jgi:hypothetical protein